MQDRPTATELLATIAELLEGDLLAATSGPLKHQVRVAGNLCRILERELSQQSDADERARERLALALGRPLDDTPLEALNAELAERLHRGDDSGLERRAWSALIEIVRDKLAVNKPGHDAYDFSTEISERR